MRMLANAPRAASIPRRGRWWCRLSPRVYSIASGNLTTMWAARGQVERIVTPPPCQTSLLTWDTLSSAALDGRVQYTERRQPPGEPYMARRDGRWERQ